MCYFSRISDAFLCSAGTAAVYFPLGRSDITETASMFVVLLGAAMKFESTSPKSPCLLITDLLHKLV